MHLSRSRDSLCRLLILRLSFEQSLHHAHGARPTLLRLPHELRDTKLRIGPQGFYFLGIRLADTDEAALLRPGAGALDA